MLWHNTFGSGTFGSGQDLVLLHGWGFNARVFNNINFGNHRITLIDLPGHGESDVINGTLNDWSEAIAAHIPDNAIVAGWSLGGLIALNIADKLNRPLKQLIMLAATPCFVNNEQWQYGIDHQTIFSFYHALKNNLNETLKQFAQLQTPNKNQAQQVYQQIKQHPAHPDALKTGLDILLNNNLAAELPTLSCPVSAILGKRDRLVPIGIQQWYQQHQIPCQVYNSGHMPFLTDNFVINQTII